MNKKPNFKYFVKLPKGSIGFYGPGRFDIVKQTRVLHTTEGSDLVRCTEPFTIKCKVNGKERVVDSKAMLT